MEDELPEGVTIPSDWAGHVIHNEYVVETGLIGQEFGIRLPTVYVDDVDEAIKVMIDGIKAGGTHWAVLKWREVQVSADEWK